MISAIRGRMTYANVAVTLALVFAMSGGAYAAGRYVITSTKQISPKVLKALQGKAGAAGRDGINGTNGSNGAPGGQGLPGPQGPEGKAGSNGTPGTSVTNTAVPVGVSKCEERGGAEFKAGTGSATYACNGQTGFTETLPEGKTEMGTWALAIPAENPTLKVPVVRVPISFVIPLGAAPTGHYLKAGEGGTPECPGTVEHPEATEGNFCVYTQAAANAPELSASTTYPFGAILGNLDLAEPGGIAFGSWAVTAG